MSQRPNHLPSLSPLELEAAFAAIDALTIPAESKAQVKAMLSAAANPHSESPDVVLQTLEPERQMNAASAMQMLDATFMVASRRGAAGLLALDDAEWERLTNEA